MVGGREHVCAQQLRCHLCLAKRVRKAYNFFASQADPGEWHYALRSPSTIHNPAARIVLADDS